MSILYKKLYEKNGEPYYELTFWGWLVICVVVFGFMGVVLFGLTKIAGATTIYEENFENFEVGELHGQGGWYMVSENDKSPRVVNCQPCYIQGDPFYGKMVRSSLTNNPGSWIYRRNITPINNGIISFKSDMGDCSFGGYAFRFLNNNNDVLFDIHTTCYQIYLTSGQNNKALGFGRNFVEIQIEFTENQVRAKYIGDWSDWIDRISGDVEKIEVYFNRTMPSQYGYEAIFFDDFLIRTEILPPTLEFIQPENSQTLNDFSKWKTKITPYSNIDPPLMLIVNYSKTGTGQSWYDWSLPSNIGLTENVVRYWDFFKQRVLTPGNYTAKLFLHQTDDVNKANSENLIAESDIISFTIATTSPPVYPTPSPQFGTSTWGIDNDYIIHNYASNIPEIFGTTTPYSFYLTITNGFNNFVKPFAEFILSIKSKLETINTEGYGSSTAYILNLTTSLNQIFNFPIIPVILIYILFLISFFIFKFVFKLIRG